MRVCRGSCRPSPAARRSWWRLPVRARRPGYRRPSSAAGLLSADHPGVIVLQPRRVAARTAAARIADEQGWALGEEVGYQVRFERRFSPQTRLRFLTEGILTRQLLDDPFLESVGAVVLDEFHERNLNSDLALALLREVRREVRPDLILVVMSATLDAEPVARFLDDCPIVRSEGRSYEVGIEYRPLEPAGERAEPWYRCSKSLVVDPRASGHILVFLPGMAEIERVRRRLEPAATRAGALVLPLHGSLPADDQDRALAPGDRRKVILSTNVAETSLTIDGVTTVIDTGLARNVRYDAERGIDRWELARISRAAADQRAGRAGRTGPGRCIRLWSEREHRGLADFEQPEIHRVDLCATVLALHAWGTADPAQFALVRPASARATGRRGTAARHAGRAGRHTSADHPAWGTRCSRCRSIPGWPGCWSRQGTTAGFATAPPSPRCFRNGTSARGMMQRARTPAPLGDPPRTGLSDILDRLDHAGRGRGDAVRSFSAVARHRSRGGAAGGACSATIFCDAIELASTRHVHGDHDHDDETVLRWLLLAYPDRVVKRRGAERTGVMVGGRGVRLGPESVVRDAELYLALDAREDRRAGPREAQVRLASTIKLEWLEELFPDDVRRERLTRYDESRRRVIGVNQLWYHDLLLREDPSASVNPGEAGLVLAEALWPRAASLVRGPAPGRPLARSTGFRQAGLARTGLDSTSTTRPWRRSSPRSAREERASTRSNRPISSLFCKAGSLRA